MKDAERIAELEAALRRYELLVEQLQAQLNLRRRKQHVSGGEDERETIRAVFLRNGFTIKEGQTDLKPYVYDAAHELLSIARAALSPAGGGVVPEALSRSFITGESSDGSYRVVIKSATLQETQQVHNWLAHLNAKPKANSQDKLG